MLLNLSVGAPAAALGNNSQPVARGGPQGDLIVSELHGRYYETTRLGNKFSGAITGQVTTLGLATTYTGLCLSNPIGSGKNLVVTKAAYAFIVAFAAGATIGLMTGYSAVTAVIHTAAVTTKNQLIGTGAVGVGTLDSSATLPIAPTINTILDAGITGAITTATKGCAGIIDLEGSLILPPGAFVAFYTSTVSGAAGGAFSFTWEEVPA